MTNPAINSDFQLATFAGGTGSLHTLSSLNVPNPHPIWNPAVVRAKLGNNGARLLGAPRVEWHWGYVSQAVRDILRAYCPGASAQVYLITPTTENVGSIPNVSARYSAQMWWPSPESPEDPSTGRRLQFVITFKQLVTA